MSRADQHKPAAGRSPPNWPLRLGGLVVLVVVAVAAFQAINAKVMYGKLLRAEADRTPQNLTLAKFADEQAKPLFASQCASCHGANLKGDRKTGVPDLTDKDWLYGTGRVGEIERTILYGIRSGHPRTWNLADMPAFGQANPYRRYKVAPLQPPEIRDLIEYIRAIEDKPADAAAAARGVKLFADRGQCFDCHANDGQGDTAIGAPNLTDDTWLYGDGSRESLFKSIAQGHHGVSPAFVGRLKPGQIRALAVYVYNASHPAGPVGQTHAAAVPAQPEKRS